MRHASLLLRLVGAFLLTSFLPPASTHAQSSSAVFAGTSHQALGASTLTLDATRRVLTIDGLGSNGGGVTYQLDVDAGSIQFGDGLRGTRPSSGSWNVQATYRYGSGTSGAVQGAVNALGPVVIFDHGPVGTNSVAGTISRDGEVVAQFDFSPLVNLNVDEWPAEVELGIDEGEMLTAARWELPIIVFLPDGSVVDADEVVFRSQSGGALAGEEIGAVTFEGFGLDLVQFLGERSRVGDRWFEAEGNLQLERGLLGHELTHVVQDGTPGTYTEFAPSPCYPFDPQEPDRLRVGLQTEALLTTAPPAVGTRTDHLVYASLDGQSMSGIPTHSKEWTDTQTSDPGMTLIGGFIALGAVSYTVQVFYDGLLVDSETGLGPEVARVKEYVGLQDQSDLDFLHQRAAAQVDLGSDQEITILANVPRTVVGDRVHIIPEQIQIFPDCIEAVGVRVRRVPDVTLKRGVISAALPPARVSGIKLKPIGDLVLIGEAGQGTEGAELVNQAWGLDPTGPLAGSTEISMSGLGGMRWALAGDLDPSSAPSGSQRSFRVGTRDVNGQRGSAGLDVLAQTGVFSIAHDLGDLGSSDADVIAFLDGQVVYTGVLPQQGRILVDSDLNEASAYETADGLYAFDMAWDGPQSLLIGGQAVMADRVSERLRHRDRAVTVWDYEHLVLGTPGIRVGRASVRPRGAWWSAVGDVEFADFSQNPVFLDLLDPTTPSGLEVESEEDPQGNAFAQLVLPDPGQYEALDGDEVLTLEIEESDESSTKRRATYPPARLVLSRNQSRWSAGVDLEEAGYTGFRVLADGVGEIHASSSPTGAAFISEAWPETWTVLGVADGLWIDLEFPVDTQVEIPGGNLLTTSGLTVIAEGAGRPPFGSGLTRFLFEGQTAAAVLLREPAVAVEDGVTPRWGPDVVLRPARPNPFNPTTELSFELVRPGRVELSIHDAAGRRVRTLLRESRGEGLQRCLWHGRDDRGSPVASGVYFVRLAAGTTSVQQKIVLLK